MSTSPSVSAHSQDFPGAGSVRERKLKRQQKARRREDADPPVPPPGAGRGKDAAVRSGEVCASQSPGGRTAQLPPPLTAEK